MHMQKDHICTLKILWSIHVSLVDYGNAKTTQHHTKSARVLKMLRLDTKQKQENKVSNGSFCPVLFQDRIFLGGVQNCTQEDHQHSCIFQSNKHWYCLQGNVRETSERQSGAHIIMGFPEHVDTTLN